MTPWLVAFFLMLSRVTAFFLFLPVFGWQAIVMRVRVATTVLVTVTLAAVLGLDPGPGPWGPVRVILQMLQETTYGLALGVVAACLFFVVRIAGRMIEREMGLAMAEVMDPLTGERIQPVGSALEMVFILLFLAANGHHFLLLSLSRSFQAYPLGTAPSIARMTEAVVQAGSVMLLLSLRLAAPALVAFMLTLVVMAILSRVVPEMNIFFISMPARMGLGLVVTVAMLPFLQGYLDQWVSWMGRLLPV